MAYLATESIAMKRYVRQAMKVVYNAETATSIRCNLLQFLSIAVFSLFAELHGSLLIKAVILIRHPIW